MSSGLGFAPGTKQEALYGQSGEHICTPEDCPPIGEYYVSCIDDDGRVFLMAGPYRTHGLALADERRVCLKASDVDGRAWFMAWGTCRKDSREPGVLNKFKLI
jgi:hypothetical protein